jgi:hypothetical protein
MTPPSAAPVTAGESSVEKDPPRYSITVRYDTLLYDTLQNMIRSAHTAQDFTYTSLADFIRAALRAYKNGMVLTELDQNSPKMETSLPGRMRSKILERAIRTFMKQSTVERE